MIMRKAVLCITLTLAVTLSACGDVTNSDSVEAETDATETTIPPEPAEPDYYAGLTGLDLDGYTFTILSYDSSGGWNLYLTSDEESGELLNDASYRRGLEVEELLNCNIESVLDWNYESMLKSSVLAGDGSDYDLICFYSPGQRAAYITDNLLYDWNEIPYLKLDAEWYNQSANEAYAIAGKQYFAVSDITFAGQQHARILYNKLLLDELGLDSPYQAVFDGEWTIERLQSDCKAAYSDLNGNTAVDEDDRFGLTTVASLLSILPLSCGELPVKAVDGGFELNLYSEKIDNIINTMVSMCSDQNYFITDADKSKAAFMSGRALYYIYSSDPAQMRDFEVDFGYLPFPKYDKAQENYIVESTGGHMAVPINAANIDKTGAVIEALSAASNKYLKEAFISSYVENKILRDDESVRIYRMMRDAATYDISYNIDPSGLMHSHSYYAYFVNNKDANGASRWASVGDAIQTSWDELYQAAAGS